MRTEPPESVVEHADPEVPDLADVTSYEDGDAHVICEKSNPRAWIRADEPVELAN